MRPYSATIIVIFLWTLGDQMLLSYSSELPSSISAFSYFRSCALSDTIEYATYNSTVNEYQIVPGLFTRKLYESKSYFRSRVKSQEIIAQRLLVQDLLPVRQCTCPAPRLTFCPVTETASFNACAVSRKYFDSQEPATCFISPRLDLYLFVRSTWPLIVFLLSSITIFLALTQTGRNVRKYITRQCMAPICCRSSKGWFYRFFGSNESEAELILEEEIRIRHQMLESSYIAGVRMWLRLHGIEGEEDVSNFMQSLHGNSDGLSLDESCRIAYVLKTRKYVSPTKVSPSTNTKEDWSHTSSLREDGDYLRSNEENLDEDETSLCTICYNIIEDGEKVGALSCNHIFHVECLSTWIKRRNVCPLCLSPNIAERKIERSLDATRMSDSSLSSIHNNSTNHTELDSSDHGAETTEPEESSENPARQQSSPSMIISRIHDGLVDENSSTTSYELRRSNHTYP